MQIRQWVLLMIIGISCGTPQQTEYLVNTGDDRSSLVDFMSVSNAEEPHLFLKNRFVNSIDEYDLATGERIRTLFFKRFRIDQIIQSVTVLNEDSLLVFKMNEPFLYFMNAYGHVLGQWQLGAVGRTHFIISNNKPVIFNRKLYVPMLCEGALQQMIAGEWVVDLNTGEVDSLIVSCPQTDHLGLRHQTATRVLAGSSLYYVWGGSDRVWKYDLENGQAEFLPLPDFEIAPEAFNGNNYRMSDQEAYYRSNELNDHLSYNPFKEEFYLIRLGVEKDSYHKYQRPFTVFVFNKEFQPKASFHFMGGKYVFDMDFSDAEGLLMATCNPFSDNKSRNLIFERVL